MAKAPPRQQAEPPAAAPPKPQKSAKKKRRGPLIAVLLAVVAVAVGGITWVTLEPASSAPAAAPAEKPPIFVNLDTFTVNLQPEVGDQYLQVALTVKVKDDATVGAIKDQMPDIRNRLLLLLSSKRATEILTVSGKQQLAAEILGELKQPLPQPAREHVAAVYFTSFVIQ
ncbi:MAG TPA: flagellar basal body-associated protein FliL [Burkholderiales bacterium]